MESGRLRHRVIIEQVARSADALGEGAETWTTYATLWANIEPLRGREFFAAQAANSEVTARITMRYRAGISPKWRIKHGTAVYRIIEILNIGMRNRELQFMVSEQPQSVT